MAVYYISTTGSDSTGVGSSGNPWATPSKAHTAAASGDTIYCSPGTYIPALSTTTKNLTWSYITALRDVIWNGSGSNFDQKSNSVYTGIVFANYAAGGSVVWYQDSGSLKTTTFNNCEFRGGTVVANPGNYFYSQYDQWNITFNNCILNDIHGNAANSVIYTTTNGFATFTNCTFYFSTGGSSRLLAIGTYWGASTLKNCIFDNESGADVPFHNGNTGSISGGGNITKGTISNIAGITTTATTDNLFVSPGNNDFHLRQTTTIIDTGVVV